MYVWILCNELGHGIHDLVAKTKYSHFHGTACVHDICEAPSQMLERWCWRPEPLRRLSRHYSGLSTEYYARWAAKQKGGNGPLVIPPEQLPNEMIEALIQSEKVNAALNARRSLWRAMYDMKVRSPPNRASLESMDFTSEFNALQKEIVGLGEPDNPHWGHGEAHFQHLIGGYDAAFYGYL